MFQLLLASGLLALVSSDFVGHNHNNRHNHNQAPRSGRQEEQISGGIDFSGCEEDPDTGLCSCDRLWSVITARLSHLTLLLQVRREMQLH